MDELIELLNEYTNGRFKSEDDLRLCIEMRWYCRNFIKRLVENNKIDLDKIDNKIRIYDYVEEYEEYDYVFPDIYKQLLMLLSISDTPIEDLIYYLK